ncbi:MAG: DMT family transporter [Candidatus Helarchaeota archaeon]|nr:DMT family transporter [Candidatus Helarchaeota archaeon]
MSKPRVNPHIVIAVGVLGTSFAAIFVRWSSSPPLLLAFYRLLFTVFIIIPIFLWMKGWRQLRTLPIKNILIIVGAGVALAFHFVLWFASLDYTSIASAVVLVDISVIFTAVFAYLILKESLSRRRILGILIAFVGVIVISLTDWSHASEFALLGDMFALLAAVFGAIYFVAGRKTRQGLDVIPYVFLLYISCTITLLVACLFTGIPLFPFNSQEYLIFLGIAVVSTIFGHTLYNWALKYVDAAVIGIALLAEPIGSILLGLAIFVEIPHPIVIAGGVLVLGGIYLAVRINKNNSEKE